jgi:polyisoprenoid-binding protein YceI
LDLGIVACASKYWEVAAAKAVSNLQEKQMVKYEIDPAHTTVGFSTKHLAVSTVHGQFNKFEGTFEGPEGQD